MHFTYLLITRSSLPFKRRHDAGQVYKLTRDSQIAVKISWSMHGANNKLEQLGDNMNFYPPFR
jgi:hypothetical protein